MPAWDRRLRKQHYTYHTCHFPYSGRYHDTEKPVELTDILVGNSSNEGDTVFDPFMGIGGCGVSCEKLGRKFIGVELDERYYEIAKNRVQDIVFNN